MEVNDNLKIDIQLIQPELVRQTKISGPARERVTSEKYFRQAIQVYNRSGNLVDSGFIKINDYTDGCKTVRVCNEFEKIYHIFEVWEHFGTQFYKTSKYRITDLVTGNSIATIESIYLESFIEKTQDKNICLVGDLEKDEYSKILLECLDEYNKSNEPENVKSLRNKMKNEKCGCNLFEYLDINQSFRNGEINEKKRDILINNLICECNNNKSEKNLTKNEKNVTSELKFKAQSEIEKVLSIKELEKDVANMV